MRTVWKVRLVVTTILAVIALAGWVQKSYALTVNGWNVLGGFTCTALGSQAWATTPKAQTWAPGLTTTVAYSNAGNAAKTSYEDGMYIDRVDLASSSVDFVATSASRSSPATTTGYYTYIASLWGSVKCMPVDSPAAGWAIYQLPQQISGFSGQIGGVNKFNNYTLDRYQEYVGAGKWLRTTPVSGTGADDGYALDYSWTPVRTWVAIAAEFDPDVGYWSWQWRISDRMQLRGQGSAEQWSTSSSGTGTVLPTVSPVMTWPRAWQQVNYPTVDGARKLPVAVVESDFTVSWDSSGMIAESFTSTNGEAMQAAISTGWDTAFPEGEIVPALPLSVDESATAMPAGFVPRWLQDWIDSQMDIVEGYSSAFDGFFWPLRTIGEM